MPALGHHSGREKLGAVLAADMRRLGRSAPTTYRTVSTIRWPWRASERRRYRNTHRLRGPVMGRPLQSGGYGRCGGDGSLPWMGSRPVFPWAGAGGTLCVPAGHAFRDRAECLTLQTVACERGKRLIPPLWGLATWSGDGWGRGGGPVVVTGVTTCHGGRESRSQGEGVQREDRANWRERSHQ